MQEQQTQGVQVPRQQRGQATFSWPRGLAGRAARADHDDFSGQRGSATGDNSKLGSTIGAGVHGAGQGGERVSDRTRKNNVLGEETTIGFVFELFRALAFRVLQFLYTLNL